MAGTPYSGAGSLPWSGGVAVEVEVEVEVGSVDVVVCTGSGPFVAGTPYLGAGAGPEQPAATVTRPSSANTAVLGIVPSLLRRRAPQCGQPSRDAESSDFTGQLQLGQEMKGRTPAFYTQDSATGEGERAGVLLPRDAAGID